MERREIINRHPEHAEELAERIDIMVVDGEMPQHKAEWRACKRIVEKYHLEDEDAKK